MTLQHVWHYRDLSEERLIALWYHPLRALAVLQMWQWCTAPCRDSAPWGPQPTDKGGSCSSCHWHWHSRYRSCFQIRIPVTEQDSALTNSKRLSLPLEFVFPFYQKCRLGNPADYGEEDEWNVSEIVRLCGEKKSSVWTGGSGRISRWLFQSSLSFVCFY